jgi:hypothetical protein
MKLVDNNGNAIIEFMGSTTIIHDDLVRAELERYGIAIPILLRNAFRGKKIVLLEDTFFQKALKEFYIPRILGEYKWQE